MVDSVLSRGIVWIYVFQSSWEYFLLNYEATMLIKQQNDFYLIGSNPTWPLNMAYNIQSDMLFSQLSLTCSEIYLMPSI